MRNNPADASASAAAATSTGSDAFAATYESLAASGTKAVSAADEAARTAFPVHTKSVRASALFPLYPPSLSMMVPPMKTPMIGAVIDVRPKATVMSSCGLPITLITYGVTQNWMPVTTKKSDASAHTVQQYTRLPSSASSGILLFFSFFPFPSASSPYGTTGPAVSASKSRERRRFSGGAFSSSTSASSTSFVFSAGSSPLSPTSTVDDWMVDIGGRGVMWRWLPPCDDDPDDDEVCRVVVFESRVNGASSVAPPKRISAAETTRGRPLAASSAVHDGVAHRPLTERERERGRPVALSWTWRRTGWSRRRRSWASGPPTSRSPRRRRRAPRATAARTTTSCRWCGAR